MLHDNPSELAGTTVRIKDEICHPQDSGFGGSKFCVEDWWDRVSGKSWMLCDGNPACLMYATRAGSSNIPSDDEVLYGKVGGFGHLIHVSELVLEPNVASPVV